MDRFIVREKTFNTISSKYFINQVELMIILKDNQITYRNSYIKIIITIYIYIMAIKHYYCKAINILYIFLINTSECVTGSMSNWIQHFF